MPLFSNTNPVHNVDHETTLDGTPTSLLTALDVDIRNEEQLILGLRRVACSLNPTVRRKLKSTFLVIAQRLSESGRWSTLVEVKLVYKGLSNAVSATQPTESNSSSPTTTKIGNSRASKPVILINGAARKQSTTIKAAPQQYYQSTDVNQQPIAYIELL